jgi:hypothetical protein
MSAYRHLLTAAGPLWLLAALAHAIAGPAATTPPAQADRQAQGQVELAQICAKVVCRAERREIRLRAEGGTAVVMTEMFPYVDTEGSIVIYAGEAFSVSFPDPNDPSKPRFLHTIADIDNAPLPAANEPRILMLQFGQIEGDTGMMLTMRNATGVALKFDAIMYVPTRNGMGSASTSICALLPGMFNTESWPHPVAMLVLNHIRKVDVTPNADGVVTMSC